MSTKPGHQVHRFAGAMDPRRAIRLPARGPVPRIPVGSSYGWFTPRCAGLIAALISVAGFAISVLLS